MSLSRVEAEVPLRELISSWVETKWRARVLSSFTAIKLDSRPDLGDNP